MTRRKFIANVVKGAVATGIAGAGFAFADAYACAITRREVGLPGLPPAFDGFQVALLTDLHHGPWISADYLRRIVKETNALGADLVALTGDYVHRGKQWVPGVASALADLRAKHGAVGVLGNHDHYRNAASSVREGLSRAGVTDLTNRGVTLQRGGETFHIAGTGDYWKEKQHLDKALAGSRDRGSVLLLQHNPDYAEKIMDERVGLMLSGHTHGGQIVLPFIGAPVLPSSYGQKYASGLCQGPVTKVYVSHGIGCIFPPVRFGCPPEIVLLTLRRSQAVA